MSMNHRICILYNNSLQCVRVRVGHDIPQLSDVSRQIILIPIALLFWKFPTLHCWWNGRCATRTRPVKSPRVLWIWITLIIQSNLVCWITGVWSTVWRKSVSFMRVQYIIRRVVTLKKKLYKEQIVKCPKKFSIYGFPVFLFLRSEACVRLGDHFQHLFKCALSCVCTHTHTYIYIWVYIQGVPGGMCQTSGKCFLR